MAVTMKDIAQRANVSIVTVSRALNNKDDINPETKDRILKIARELDYTGNDVARSLITQKTGTIGVIVPNAADTFYASVIQGVNNRCFQKEYSIILCSTKENTDKELEYITLLRKKRVEGFLIYPLQQDARYIKILKAIDIPFVMLNRHTEALNSSYVINDNVSGTYEAVQYLIQQGHTKITYICAKPEASSGRERIDGCRKAMNESGLQSRSLHVLYCEETITSCYNLVKSEIRNGLDSTALFGYDDKLALGAMRAIYEEGLRIPEDIAIVGYDDIETAAFYHPPLTTVRQPAREIGEIAADILMKNLTSDNSWEQRHVVLKPKLIIRESA